MQEAAAIEAKGRAQATAIEANLNAEAEGIRAKGLAEAEAMEKKAEAYNKYGQVAIIDMLTRMNEKVLPEVAKNIAEPMSKIGNMTVYGTSGTEPSGGAKREISSQLIEDLEPGDYVMVHAGVAIAKITDEDDSETDQVLED